MEPIDAKTSARGDNAFLLTRRTTHIRLSEKQVEVEVKGQVVWQGPCSGWRWRKAGEYIVGIQLLGHVGVQPYLVKSGAIPTGYDTAYLELVESLCNAGINEAPIPPRNDRPVQLALGILILVVALALVWMIHSYGL